MALALPSTSALAARKSEMRWIVTLAPGTAMDGVIVQAQSLGARVGVRFEQVLLGFTMSGSWSAADALASNPNVTRILPDGAVQLSSADVVPTGVARTGAPVAHGDGLTGEGAVVAVIDSGIDLTHPDLVGNLHPTLGKNCLDPPQNSAPPQDLNGHGTHVAGIVAAAANDVGVIGVAPEATLVPVQAFDALGNAHWSNVICGIDYVAAHADEIDVANMSFGDLSTLPTTCGDGAPVDDIDALHEAICGAMTAGVVMVAAAGNNAIDSQGFVPASFPEVITVSALTDLDGAPGASGGCLVFGAICDDSFSSLFSNYGASIEVMAPGFEILSTVPGGYATKDGTSMAAPHVAGAIALMRSADPGLTQAEIAYMIRRNGECPDGTMAAADATCAGQGLWQLDPDAIPEPLLDVRRSALAATYDAPPEVTLTAAIDGTTVSGSRTLTAAATDDRGLVGVAFAVDGVTVATDADGEDGWRALWTTTDTIDGPHAITAVAIDTGGQSTPSSASTAKVLNHLHIGDLTGYGIKTKNTWTPYATVTVHSGIHASVGDAVVTINGNSCTTTADGTCTVSSNPVSHLVASVTFNVAAIQVTGGARDTTADHDPAPVAVVVVLRPT